MPEKPAQLIFAAVKLHEGQIGSGTLARILKGAKTKKILEKNLHTSKLFGALFYQTIDVIENYIKQLVRQEYLKVVDIGKIYHVPVLRLAEKGQKALNEQAEIPLQKVITIKRLELTENLQTTLDLYLKFKDVKVVAQKRGLAETTILGHIVDLVQLQQLKAEDVVSEQKIRLITEANLRLKTKRLKELKEALPPEISYEEIKCVLAQSS